MWVPLVRDLPGASMLVRPLDDWFALQCHRDDGRRIEILNGALPVCARCLGIYSGLALGALLLRPRLSFVAVRNWVVIGSALMVADVASERFAMHGSWPWARMATGVILGFPVGIGTVLGVRNDCERRRRFRGRQDTAH